MKKSYLIVLLSVGIAVTSVFSSDVYAKKRIVFGGGPAGGTFQVFANAIQVYKPIKRMDGYNIQAQSSAGSVENLRRVNSGKSHFAVVYSGDIWQARDGMMKNDKRKYLDVLAVSYLYGAPAQLVVRADSGIQTCNDLIGKRVGVGNAGSGAFANCELFFTHIGIWDKIKRNAMGYNDAANAFGNRQLDAFWLFTAFPSGAVIMAAQTNYIALIDLDKAASSSRFYDKYPYFNSVFIPAHTYRGVDSDVASFQDCALWVANTNTPASLVYQLLSIVYTDEGLQHMVNQKKTFKEMHISNGVRGIITPLHPGAEKFWREKGVFR
ncbi:MAG: TAXI family TRAP transporter solute-binding subunit [Thermodesulfobacteriota bacterium]|nr:TAXI family TRAP transporter solute-binding subunit [Thermodesulfobacteriota bacterium]